MNRSFRLATLFNIPVEINYSWFIILGLVIFTLARGYFPLTNPELPEAAHWLLAAAAALLLFASLLAHEFSHALVAVRHDLPIHGITLFVFGGVAHMEKEPSAPGIEFKMAAAGPAMSFLLACLFFALTQISYGLGLPNALLSLLNYLFLINLAVGLFNLIPGYPLDGGRLLRAALWHFLKNLKRATRIASFFGKAFAFALIAYGLLHLLAGSLVAGLWFIFIGLFLQEAAGTSYQQIVLRRALSGVPVGKVMTRSVVTVPAGLTLDRLVDDYFFRFRYTSFPVVEDDALRGLVTLHAVKQVEKKDWPRLTAGEIMLPLDEKLTIGADHDVIDALARMGAAGMSRLLVTDGGKLAGILTQRDITRLFELKSKIDEE
ncbi:MAG: site-2 protease family protein [Candidatus Saganbacteria bacterium]|nr:site-2 protease family protein [Candidatus Saganbacteria bacterium]